MTRGQARNTRGPGLECNLRGYQPRGMPAVSTDGAVRRLSYSTTSSDDGECDNAAFISCYLYRGEASGLGMPALILRSAAWILDSGGFTDSTPTHGSGQSEEPWLPPFCVVVLRERMTPIAIEPSPV